MMVRIDTIIIFTTQMEALADFYQKGLALAVEPNKHGGNHIGFPLDNTYLGFDQVAEANASNSVTLWFDVADLDEAFGRFVDLGATVRYPPTLKPFGDTLASLHDLDGNIIGLVSRAKN